MSLNEKVTNIIVDKLSVDVSRVVPEASFLDDLGADSLDTVELVMALEEEFELEIADEEAEKISTVQEAVNELSANPESKILAGGMTIIPTMKQRLASPEQLIDIRNIFSYLITLLFLLIL